MAKIQNKGRWSESDMKNLEARFVSAGWAMERKNKKSVLLSKPMPKKTSKKLATSAIVAG